MFEKLGGNPTVMPDLDSYSNEELLTLRDMINIRVGNLKDINLEQELVGQFVEAKQMLIDVRDDDEIPPTQKASLISACSSLLSQLTKSQKELYNSERIKVMEAVMIEVLKEQSEELCKQFLAEYERRLENLS